MMLALLVGVLLSASAAPAQEPSAIRVQSFTLTNGLRVHVVDDSSAAVVAVNLWYDVGSRNERPGRTGFAHLFEHMMSQGSANVAKGEHMQLIERAGGESNGSTTPDRTNYFQVVPSNRLNLALWLEADRMRSLVISQENLDNQREAVKEERRLRFDNQPYLSAIVDSLPVLFDPERCFAYAHSTIGSMADLDSASVEDVSAFFAQYYAPNNAVLVVVGDARLEQVRALVQQYFGTIPAAARPPAVACDLPRGAAAPVVKRLADRNATLPAVLTAFRAVPPRHDDYPALVLLASILGEGESSRLNRTLVRGSRVAVGAQVLHDPFGPMRGGGIFGVLAVANAGVSADSLQRVLARQLLLSSDGITDAELEKARNAWRARTTFGRLGALERSESIQHAAMFLGSAAAVNVEAARFAEVTTADLRRVARQYLRPDAGLTLVIEPAGEL